MNDLLNLLKEKVLDTAQSQLSLPETKKTEICDNLTTSIMEGLKEKAGSATGIGELTSLLSGSTSASSSPVTTSITNYFVENFASKLGLNTAVTSSVKSVIPKVLDKVVAAVKDGDISVDKIITMLGGESSIKNIAGGIFSKFFG